MSEKPSLASKMLAKHNPKRNLRSRERSPYSRENIVVGNVPVD